ncbi:Type I phosphodiesterase/nucleotide pyrophosphatase/phosphate transferase [Penicillium argentinense]|uniref:Type I phosphodiesterase/nucleotide pyrophosphatase/phosphate transferase n=1 Tax=Penicillium argentinense TaxID=1131581 RepID=A0A9W9JXJ9_9EURO|nr:Type I phosphodiesterase/nucleotide pyrophosphatase/phosphate transferase [Penicillium argentinense]KAJ5085170.1 Type I phosphodiesterase/nucleotide pyrophosphatase/phosphate transferase [Penicillium argentinense]
MPKLETALLSPSHYDNDAASLRSPSEQDSDSEDDEFLRHPRSTLELNNHDRAVLDDEDELEKLLTRRGPAHGLRRMFSPNGSSVRIGKKERRRARREARQSRRERVSEEGELMYEMEEGIGDDTDSLMSGSSWDLGEKEDYLYEPPSRPSWLKILLVSAVIVVFFFILLLGAYKASSGFRASRAHPQSLLSNGTALFAPTTILISLDGFRADFLDRGLTPSLNSLVANGVSPQYMNPSFPSVTFPNHFTLVTGLYPESHGVVGNTFWDPELEEEFYYTHPAVSMLPKWWNAEPLWVTAEKQGVRTGIHMWPGSEAHIGEEEPSYVDKYNGSESLSRKINRVLEFLDLPGAEDESHLVPERPQLIAAYVPDVDRDGHKYGPNSTEIRATISHADEMVGGIMAGLEARNLTNVVNVVVVSDHGMATTSIERLVQLEHLVDLNLVEHIDGWPSRGLRPKRPEDLPTLQKQLEDAAPKYAHAVEIYTRETMPERYHFQNNDRIAPLWIIPKTGWAIVERPEFDAKKALETGEVYSPKGIHGYDHEHPLMRAIFIARGPAFPHKPNSRLEAFQNIEVYNILCDSLGVDPVPNNGTLRLPLKPVGLHSDEDAPLVDTPSDPPETIETATTAVPPEPTSPASSAPTMNPESDDEKGSTWWGTLWDKVESKFDDWKEWTKELFDAEHDNHPEDS